jgi:hypothetical protein
MSLIVESSNLRVQVNLLVDKKYSLFYFVYKSFTIFVSQVTFQRGKLIIIHANYF